MRNQIDKISSRPDLGNSAQVSINDPPNLWEISPESQYQLNQPGDIQESGCTGCIVQATRKVSISQASFDRALQSNPNYVE